MPVKQPCAVLAAFRCAYSPNSQVRPHLRGRPVTATFSGFVATSYHYADAHAVRYLRG